MAIYLKTGPYNLSKIQEVFVSIGFDIAKKSNLHLVHDSGIGVYFGGSEQGIVQIVTSNPVTKESVEYQILEKIVSKIPSTIVTDDNKPIYLELHSEI